MFVTCESCFIYSFFWWIIPALFLPSSHLLWTSCDKWVYNFSYDFSDTVGGYGFWRMCSYCVQALCNFSYGHLETGRTKRTEITWKSCSADVVAVQRPQILYRNPTALIWAPYLGISYLEGNVGDIVFLQAQMSPYKSGTQLKTSPWNQIIWTKLLPISDN